MKYKISYLWRDYSDREYIYQLHSLSSSGLNWIWDYHKYDLFSLKFARFILYSQKNDQKKYISDWKIENE